MTENSLNFHHFGNKCIFFFRQDNSRQDLDWLTSFVSTAVRIVTLVTSIISPDTSSNNNQVGKSLKKFVYSTKNYLFLQKRTAASDLNTVFTFTDFFSRRFFSCLFTISDRNDIASSGTGDDLDVAMGTLMAYGGKYLREMALWAWEYGTQTPVESLGKPIQATQTLAEVASVT